MKSYLRLLASLLVPGLLSAQEFSPVQNTTRQFELTEVGTSRDRVWLATDLDTGEKNVLIAMSSTDAIVHGLPYNLGKVGATVTFHSWFTVYINGAIVADELWVAPPPKQPGTGLTISAGKAGGKAERPFQPNRRRGKLVGDEPVITAASLGELKALASQGP